MRWHDVILAITTAAVADSTLAGIYGEVIRQKGNHELLLPSLEYLLVSDTETEVFEPTVIQWDQFTLTTEDLIASERALRALFDHELGVVIEGVTLLCQFIDGATLETPSGDNYYARAIRFEFEPVRSSLERS